MNEASSKFVDTLATEKLLKEKLAKVSHSPNNSVFNSSNIPLDKIKEFCLDQSQVREFKNATGLRGFILPSSQATQHEVENSSIYLYYHPAEDALGNILFIHGLFDDNMFNYAFLIKLLNESKFNVFFMALPFHYDRKPKSSYFSGEFFFSADVHRSQYAFKQAVYDVEASLQLIGSMNALPSMLVGFSMGGCVAFRYHLLAGQAVKLFLINPVAKLMTLVWDSPLLVYVGRDLKNSGFDLGTYEEMFKELDPCENLFSGYDSQNIAMVYSAYDQIIELEKSKAFIEKTGITKTHLYRCGHLNVLRVPRLLKDIQEFYNS